MPVRTVLLVALLLPAGSSATLGGPIVPPGPSAIFGWPVVSPQVVRRYEPPPRPWLAGHRGVDLAALPGSVVRAAGDGFVRYAGVVAGRGVVSLVHPGGLRTTYEPVTAVVRAGDRVRAGQLIGSLDPGHPGCPGAACLHWGLRRNDEYGDPLALLGLARVRLLPLGDAERPSVEAGGG